MIVFRSGKDASEQSTEPHTYDAIVDLGPQFEKVWDREYSETTTPPTKTGVRKGREGFIMSACAAYGPVAKEGKNAAPTSQV